MKAKKAFVFLDPTISEDRHKRVQFMLDDTEYALLEAAASSQGVKPGELAGTIFRKHILPGLTDEVNRLRQRSKPSVQDSLVEASVPTVNEFKPISSIVDKSR